MLNPAGAIFHPSNGVLLRSDLHKAMDDALFVLYPKGTRVTPHCIDWVASLAAAQHNVPARVAGGTSPKFVFARFVYNLMKQARLLHRSQSETVSRACYVNSRPASSVASHSESSASGSGSGSQGPSKKRKAGPSSLSKQMMAQLVCNCVEDDVAVQLRTALEASATVDWESSGRPAEIPQSACFYDMIAIIDRS